MNDPYNTGPSHAPAASRGPAFGTALGGGIVGAALTAALLLFAAPQMVGGRIVREALLKDPHILVETSDALRDRQYEPTLNAQRAALERPFGSSWKGAANPDVVLVEFFDYACAYCRASNPHIDQLLREDKRLRVVYRELPILGPESVAAARLSLAASKSGRFAQFYDALYSAGRPAADTIAIATRAAGLNTPVAPSPDAEEELKRNFALAGALGATGTPLFIVGDRVMNSAVGYATLKQAVADARAKS
jgi:protein-disulfide isomerase